MAKLKVKGDDKTITVRVPIAIRKRGGRKLVIAPDGSTTSPVAAGRHVDDAVVKAIARAFRWQELLENGTYATIAEIAEAEKINESYVGRLLRLTLLSPSIIETILSGTRRAPATLDTLMRAFPTDWQAQADYIHRVQPRS